MRAYPVDSSKRRAYFCKVADVPVPDDLRQGQIVLGMGEQLFIGYDVREEMRSRRSSGMCGCPHLWFRADCLCCICST
jgi:hypothetical protein